MQSFPSLKKRVEEESLKPKGGHNSASSLDLRKIATTTPKPDVLKEDTRGDATTGGGTGDKLRRRYSADNMRAQISDSDGHDDGEVEGEVEHDHEELFTMDEDDNVTANVTTSTPIKLLLFPSPQVFSSFVVMCLYVVGDGC